MSTGTDIVQRALQLIGAGSVFKNNNTTALENGRKVLNSYIASLQDDNIDIGAVPLNAIGDELSEPLGVTNTIVENLAILLQPYHEGSSISPQLRVNAYRGANSMRNTYQVIDIPKPVARSTLPRGVGNFRRNARIFTNKGETIG